MQFDFAKSIIFILESEIMSTSSELLELAREFYNIRCEGELDYQPLYEQALRDWAETYKLHIDNKQSLILILTEETRGIEERLSLFAEDPDLHDEVVEIVQEHQFKLDQVRALSESIGV